MRRIIIFGNSGSGKSTLAKKLSREQEIAHLDLDTLAWLPTSPPERAPLSESKRAIADFFHSSDQWVIEGCYADLLAVVVADASELIFLNLPVEACIENARNRPWEPHKYISKAAQDANLDMLIDWIEQYPVRSDLFSKAAHQSLYDRFSGTKQMYTSNVDTIC